MKGLENTESQVITAEDLKVKFEDAGIQPGVLLEWVLLIVTINLRILILGMRERT